MLEPEINLLASDVTRALPRHADIRRGGSQSRAARKRGRHSFCHPLKKKGD
jgi:hypothetical protein